MADYDELLADANVRLPVIRNLCGEGTADLVAELAAALRATLAAQSESLYEGTGNAVLYWLDARTIEECAAMRAVVYAAAAGSATPTEDD